MREVIASVRIELQDDPVKMAEALGTVATAWSEFLDKLLPIVPEMALFDVNQTRTKAVRKPRRPKLITTAPPPEAA